MHKRIIVAVILLFAANSAFGGTVQIPKTGQTKCYNTAGTEITPCTNTKQDGDFQKGVEWPNPRFTDNGNGYHQRRHSG